MRVGLEPLVRPEGELTAVWGCGETCSQNYADAEELRAHPHHSFTLEGDLLMRLSERGTLQVH